MADCTDKGGILVKSLYQGIDEDGGKCTPNSLQDGVVVLTNLLQILLQAAGVLAVVFVIIGGLMYVTSAGDPARVARAKTTITNAILGLVLSLSAITIIQFIGGSF